MIRANLSPAARIWASLQGLLHRSLPGGEVKATLPADTRVYAVGDVHGRLDLLRRLEDMILRDSTDAPARRVIVYLGDYIDRGPDSRGVVEHLLSSPPDGFEVRHLRGNHDQALLDFLANPSRYRIWKQYGAPEMLLSYGVAPPRRDDSEALTQARDRLAEVLPATHLAFLEGLVLNFELGDYYFVHAGVRPGLALSQQDPADLLGIREDFLGSTANFGKVIVHGHSASPEPALLANRIGVDTGAYITGRLTCAVLEGEDCRFLST